MFDKQISKLIESQAKSFLAKLRAKAEEFLDTRDLDENGVKDKAQLLEDFDKASEGLLLLIKHGGDLIQLAMKYYVVYGPKKKVAAEEAESEQPLA